MVRFAEISSCKTIETTVGFLRYTRIAIMVTFPSNSSQTIIETTVGFLR